MSFDGAVGATPFWRSLLYVPVISSRFVDKAHTRGADAIQLDLEDSVPAGEKERARQLLPAAVDRLDGLGCDVVVRINRPWRLAVRDLEAAVRPGVRALALPKVGSAEHVRAVDEIIAELEQAAGIPVGATRIIAMVETTDGLFQMRDIAGACPRVMALNLGSEDFATSAGITPEPDLLAVPNQMTVYAARAAGILPLGLVSTVASYADEDAFREIARQSRRVGFVGASAIHPKQVTIINEEFSLSDAEVDRARRLVSAYDAALADGTGAIEFEGTMVDEPVAQRARALLARHEATTR